MASFKLAWELAARETERLKSGKGGGARGFGCCGLPI